MRQLGDRDWGRCVEGGLVAWICAALYIYALGVHQPFGLALRLAIVDGEEQDRERYRPVRVQKVGPVGRAFYLGRRSQADCSYGRPHTFSAV